MSFQLTTGIIKHLGDMNSVPTDVLESQPTMQFLLFKKVVSASEAVVTMDRYCAIMSDRQHFLQAMIAMLLNKFIETGQVGKHSVAVIEQFSCNLMQDKRLLIIMKMHVLTTDVLKIGNPKLLASSAVAALTAALTLQSTTSAAGVPLAASSSTMSAPAIKQHAQQQQQLMDDTGEIRVTGFNNIVNELYDKLQEGKVYYVSKAKVVYVKKKYSNVQNEYELSFEHNTEVKECLDASDVPVVKFNFVEISKLHEILKDSTIDVISIVKEIADAVEINTRNNKTLTKRELTFIDHTQFFVCLTLWGKQAQDFTVDRSEPVIAVKGVKVGKFGGCELIMISTSTMHLNPDIADAHMLHAWYDAVGNKEMYQVQSSSGSTSGLYGQFNRADVLLLHEVQECKLGLSDRQNVFSVHAMIMHIKMDNIAYPACQSPGCSKKVVEGSDSWRCEKCDYSGQVWLHGFNEVGQTIFDMSADELMNTKDQLGWAIEHAIGKMYIFFCKAKMNTFNDKTRICHQITQIIPSDYHEEGKYLTNLLLRSHWAW